MIHDSISMKEVQYMWEFTNDRPVYIQIIDEILARIANGVYQPGERIPSVRDLAAEARVNPNTMQRALSEVERTGYIISLRTSGKFVTDNTELINGLRNGQAESVIRKFADELEKMGISIEDAISMLRKIAEDRNN